MIESLKSFESFESLDHLPHPPASAGRRLHQNHVVLFLVVRRFDLQ